LAAQLESEWPYDWSITVADNGSTDGTWEVVTELSEGSPRIRTLHLKERGRGRALKYSWMTSDADIVAYMDVDMSTGLEALRPLIDPIAANVADLSIGSRLAAGAQTTRSLRREVVSRIYNQLTRATFGFTIRDAQCGFKAIRSDVARALIPFIEDDGWFFDTELLVMAWRCGLRINEVPVRWIEDEDSRVKILRTAADDLKGIWRIRRHRVVPSVAQPSKTGGSIQPFCRTTPTAPSSQTDFDMFADRYEATVDRSVAFTGRNAAFFARRKVALLGRIARAKVGTFNSLSVLDVGCGTGTLDRVLVTEVRELFGVDLSEEMLAVARQSVPEARFESYDGEKLPFPDDTFDAALAVCVLHHVPPASHGQFLGEMIRVTRPGGLLAIFEHNPFNPLTRRAVHDCECDEDAILLRRRQVKDLMSSAGVRDVTAHFYLFTPMDGVLGEALDNAMRRLPLGGQYVVAGTVPVEATKPWVFGPDN
jgi:ubiquinone/menaquinone biosynthesis C-methylase UbiE